MQQQTQFDRILGICKFISQELFNSSENLSHCSRAVLCSDVGFIAISLFQEHCSIDNERRFLKSSDGKISERLIAAEPDNIV